jgi:hypothetical protein
LQTNCPSCGAALTFRSSFSVFAVCGFCGSTVVRTDRDVQSIGTMADLPEEMTPLQVGTGLSYRGRAYELAGRVRMGWADGAWNEWYMVGGDAEGWLAEAQGFLTVAFPQPLDAAPGLGTAAVRLNQIVMVSGRSFRVADIKDATCIGSEGELPFAAPRGRAARYADMVGEHGMFASIEDAAEGRRLYTGEYVDFDDLGLHNFRALEGWAPPVGARDGDPLRI